MHVSQESKELKVITMTYIDVGTVVSVIVR